jgi:5-methyltetrahydrofolate--homocysteine methyltransferase
MFIIIGERINMTRKGIRQEVWNRNGAYIQEQVRKQAEAGATHIDVNAGGDPSKEVEDMIWLTRVVSEATELPLVFDSANGDALQQGLKLCTRPGTIINSVTAEKARIDSVLPLVQKHNTGVVALTMDDTGMPEDLEGRMAITRRLVQIATDAGVGPDRLYFDHLVRPASTNPGQARYILQAVRATREEFPEAHVLLGLSNVSYGIPQRNNLNRAFFAMLIAAGVDGAIIDPSEPGMMNTLYSSRAVLGEDEYCMEYLMAVREGKL